MLDVEECMERCLGMEFLEEEEVSQLCGRFKEILMVMPVWL